MFHPYEQGYSVLPGLFPLGHDFGNKDLDNKFFHIDEDFGLYKSIKINAVDDISQSCIVKSDVGYTSQDDGCVVDFMNRQLKQEYPDFQTSATLGGFMFKIQEDYALYQVNTDRLMYCNVCMPSGWCPSDKINKSFSEIHSPVPGMKLDKIEGLKQAMLNNGPFVRFVWSVIFEKRLNFHPSKPKKAFDPKKPEVYVKVERQVLKGFPERSLVLLLMRQYLLSIEDIKIGSLIKSLDQMSNEERVYKDIDNKYDKLLKYLKKKVI